MHSQLYHTLLLLPCERTAGNDRACPELLRHMTKSESFSKAFIASFHVKHSSANSQDHTEELRTTCFLKVKVKNDMNEGDIRWFWQEFHCMIGANSLVCKYRSLTLIVSRAWIHQSGMMTPQRGCSYTHTYIHCWYSIERKWSNNHLSTLMKFNPNSPFLTAHSFLGLS